MKLLTLTRQRLPQIHRFAQHSLNTLEAPACSMVRLSRGLIIRGLCETYLFLYQLTFKHRVQSKAKHRFYGHRRFLLSSIVIAKHLADGRAVFGTSPTEGMRLHADLLIQVYLEYCHQHGIELGKTPKLLDRHNQLVNVPSELTKEIDRYATRRASTRCI